ncbi:MAG: putative metal-binding motif-containing protein, partial [Myxococcales bacterium]|nr:putative metal-binding motif-containing protein [Myxococcales bacterium]
MHNVRILALLVLASSSLLASCGRTELDTYADRRDFRPPDAGTRCTSDAECDDGLLCTGVEACVDGSCQAGTPLTCDDGIDCTLDECVEAIGACQSTPDSTRCGAGLMCLVGVGCDVVTCTSDADCDDRRPCNGAETCVDGTCAPGPRPLCDDGIDCTVDECIDDAGGCVFTPNDSICDDRVFCNGAERCRATIGCLPAMPLRCDDGIDCTMDRCDEATRSCVHEGVDADGDGFASRECGGDDCDDTRRGVHPGVPERCTNGRDDDCNGRVDCEDVACLANPACGCVPTPELCADAVDNDCDGFVDCADPECAMDPVCVGCLARERCRTVADDDCDGLVNCADPDCFANPVCMGPCDPLETRCFDSRDDDCDGLVDCADPECQAREPLCSDCAPAETVCNDRRDDDCDGL